MIKTVFVILFILMLDGALAIYYEDKEMSIMARVVNDIVDLSLFSSFSVLIMQWLLLYVIKF